jgi:DNA-binding NarL/FixJ family response regulator
MTRIRVVVADDHTLFREGLVELLATDESFETVATAANGHDAMRLCRALRPDILLLDVEMPGPGVRSLIRQLHVHLPAVRIVVLTMHESPSMVQQLLELGAASYLVKSIGRVELIAALHSVFRDPHNVLLSVHRETVTALDGRPGAGNLSARELEVLQLVAAAYSNTQIASRLGICEGTVKRHLTNVYAKLGATSRMGAVRHALAEGLIDMTDPAAEAVGTTSGADDRSVTTRG